MSDCNIKTKILLWIKFLATALETWND